MVLRAEQKFIAIKNSQSQFFRTICMGPREIILYFLVRLYNVVYYKNLYFCMEYINHSEICPLDQFIRLNVSNLCWPAITVFIILIIVMLVAM